MAERPIQRARLPIQSNRLIHQIVIRCPLHFDREMVPRIALRIARDSRRRPFPALVVENIPLVPARNPALMAKDKTHIPEELVDVEL